MAVPVSGDTRTKIATDCKANVKNEFLVPTGHIIAPITIPNLSRDDAIL
jgi:hypothetical protein